MRGYLKLAEECLQLGLEAKREQHRRAFLDMASILLEHAGNDAKTAVLRAEVEALTRPAN
jgi:hypothetical protein